MTTQDMVTSLKEFRKKLLFKLAISSGHILNLASRKSDLLSTIELLRPVDVGHPLMRIGSDGDGGYLVPDDLEGVSACFSPGVGNTSGFEDQLAQRYGIKSYLADYSVDAPQLDNEMFDFERKFLGAITDDKFIRLEDWINAKVGANFDGDLILQMDIEGAEFDVLIESSVDTLKKFRIIIIEFHDMEMLLDRRALRLAKAVFQKMANSFTVAHIHPNNSNRLYKYGDIEIPSCFEATFLRNDRVQRGGRVLQYPHPLDQKNVPWKNDMVLPKVWQSKNAS